MYDSKITVKSLIDEMESEVDIAVDLPVAFYINSINTAEQMLYSDIIKEYAVYGMNADDSPIDLSKIRRDEKCDYMRFEDIYTVYACDHKNSEEHEADERVKVTDGYEFNDYQLMKTTLSSGVIFGDTWYSDGGKLCVNTDKKHIKLVYFIRPSLKTAETAETDTIALPPEFIDLIKCRLRGEMYKAVNEDALAAKWINDYNAWIENFSSWISSRQPSFGN